jgi:4'-phosphopantetheinyl transferase
MLRGKDEREWQERFYRLWTRKESLVKCEGQGFALSPGEISTMLVDEAQLIAYAGKTYGLCSHIFHGYMLSAALQDKQPLIRLRDWSWADYAECFTSRGGGSKMEREN